MEKRISKKEIRTDLDKYKSLEALQHSDGGKILIESCLGDILITVETLASQFKDLSHIEMITQCARLNERLAVYKVLKNAEKNKRIVEQALKEALEQDPDPLVEEDKQT